MFGFKIIDQDRLDKLERIEIAAHKLINTNRARVAPIVEVARRTSLTPLCSADLFERLLVVLERQADLAKKRDMEANDIMEEWQKSTNFMCEQLEAKNAECDSLQEEVQKRNVGILDLAERFNKLQAENETLKRQAKAQKPKAVKKAPAKKPAAKPRTLKEVKKAAKCRG